MNLRTIFAFTASVALLMVAIRYRYLMVQSQSTYYFDATLVPSVLGGNVVALAINIYGMFTTRTQKPKSEAPSKTQSMVILAFLILMIAQWYVSNLILNDFVMWAVG